MATFQKQGNKWKAIVRKGVYKQKPLIRSFDKKADAQRWATLTESEMDAATGRGVDLTVDQMVTRYKDELELIKPPGRSKSSSLELIRSYLGEHKASKLTAEILVNFTRERAAYVSPATLQQDMVYLRGLLDTAVNVWEVPFKWKAYDSAATHCKRYGLTGKSVERDRRPESDELAKILEHIDNSKRSRTPMGDIVRFAIGTCMRLSEILTIRWEDLDTVKKTVVIRSRKHPSQKASNHQEVPLLGESFALAQKQPKKENESRIFPYQAKTVGTGWQRACKAVEVEDLHFHDLRHEGISRLFEQGYGVMEVAKVSGHRDINQLRRYVNLNAEDLHKGPRSDRRGF